MLRPSDRGLTAQIEDTELLNFEAPDYFDFFSQIVSQRRKTAEHKAVKILAVELATNLTALPFFNSIAYLFC